MLLLIVGVGATKNHNSYLILNVVLLNYFISTLVVGIGSVYDGDGGVYCTYWIL